MGVHVAHLVFESFRDADDKVVDERFDGPQSSHVFPYAMVKFDVDGVFQRARKGDGQMRQVLGQFACNRSGLPILIPCISDRA